MSESFWRFTFQNFWSCHQFFCVLWRLRSGKSAQSYETQRGFISSTETTAVSRPSFISRLQCTWFICYFWCSLLTVTWRRCSISTCDWSFCHFWWFSWWSWRFQRHFRGSAASESSKTILLVNSQQTTNLQRILCVFTAWSIFMSSQSHMYTAL